MSYEENYYLSRAELINGDLMINITPKDIIFVDDGKRYILPYNSEAILALREVSILGDVKEFLNRFKINNLCVLIIGTQEQQDAFGPAISVPILHENGKDYLYKFK